MHLGILEWTIVAVIFLSPSCWMYGCNLMFSFCLYIFILCFVILTLINIASGCQVQDCSSFAVEGYNIFNNPVHQKAVFGVAPFNIIHVPCSKVICDIYSNNCTTMKDTERTIINIWYFSYMFWPTLATFREVINKGTRSYGQLHYKYAGVKQKHVLSKWHDEIFTTWVRLG